MKILVLILLLMLPRLAEAKPFKIEGLDGKLLTCGEFKDTQRAVVIRDCPELAALLEETRNPPEPTPDPTPSVPVETPSPAPPTPTPRQVTCDKRFIETGNGIQILNNYFAPGVEVHYCAYVPSTAPRSIDIQGQNHSNSSCNFYYCELISPSGVSYECDGVQPGTTIVREVGTWQVNLQLEDSIESLCEDPWGLSLTFRTKG